MQTADGLPVYETRLMVLVRNVAGYPAVSSTTVLQDVAGFKRSSKFAVNDAVALMSAAIRLGRNVTINEPELMVYAGSESARHEPVEALVFEATSGGHWDLETYRKLELVVNAQTGEILHEKNLILHADGNISGLATESSGADVCEPESSMGMPYALVTLNGNSAYADEYGNYSIPGDGNLTSKLEGRWFNVNNNSGSDASITQNTLNPNVVHNASNSSESVRAQVNGYLQSNVVRDFTLLYAPSFPTIGSQTSFPVNTGVSGTCNAFYDYSSINFYNSGNGCSNTAFSVIVHHEYGHHLVAVAGSGQGMYGEGMGDVLGVLITGDNQLARGFYSNDCVNGIRNADNNHQYPCSGGIHDCGQLISGCVWDALEAMEASYPGQSVDIIAPLAINSIMMHSGSGITPSITTDWLVLDDDDGDLDNGTPHSPEILAGFGMHNMDDWPPPPVYACCIDETCSEMTNADCLANGGYWVEGFSCGSVSCIPLSNDFCTTAQYITDGNWPLSTVGAISDNDAYNDAQCTGTYLGEMHADVWYSYIACENGSMTVSTCDLITFDSDIVVYQGTCDSMTQIACNGDGSGCADYSSITTFNVTEGANYLIRVGGWSSSSEGSGVLSVDGPGNGCETDPVLIIEYPDGRPDLVDPNGGTTVAISVESGTSDPTDGSLFYNDGSGWSESALTGSYVATFPAFDCGASVDWYISMNSTEGEVVLSPSGAPGNSWNAMAYSGSDVVFDDDFQTDQGWDVYAGAGTGNWDRTVPTTGGIRCDAPTDADGSGMCYVTGNGTNEDVDDGTTILTSPTMDASTAPVLSYYRWYSNGTDCGGADPQNDIFEVDISDDGGATWMNLETVGPSGGEVSGNWYFKEFDLANVAGFEPTSNFQVRFVCGDLNAGSVIEAAVDGVTLSKSYCDDTSCTGDTNGDGTVNVTDILAVVGAWGESGGSSDVNGDGIVDVSDLLAVVNAWGACP